MSVCYLGRHFFYTCKIVLISVNDPESGIQKYCQHIYEYNIESDHVSYSGNVDSTQACFEKCKNHESCEGFVYTSEFFPAASNRKFCYLKWGNIRAANGLDKGYSALKDCSKFDGVPDGVPQAKSQWFLL